MLENVVKMLSKRLNFEMKNLLNQKPSQLPPTNNRLKQIRHQRKIGFVLCSLLLLLLLFIGVYL